jgi:hypothetical protein
MRADDNALKEIPSLFPHLEKIHLALNGKVTRNGFWSFLQNMADRLVDLRICATGAWVFFADADLQEISRLCPNLEHFNYDQYIDRELLLTEGVIALVRGCPKLKTIVLIKTNSVQIEAFECIAEHAANLENLLVVGDSILMNNSDLCLRLGEKIEHFEVISLAEYCQRINAARQGDRNW